LSPFGHGKQKLQRLSRILANFGQNFKRLLHVVRLKSVVKPFAEWRRKKMEMQNSALLYYQINKTTKLAWKIIYRDRIGRFKTPADYDNKLSDDL
jgi:hypothetical protein